MVETGSLASHLMNQNVRVAEARRSWRTPVAGSGPRTYQMAFPAKGARGAAWRRDAGPSGDKYSNAGVLPAPACPRNRGHLEEGNLPHPRCAQCNMLVPRRALNGRHPATAQCARGAERKSLRLAESEMRESSERAFEVYGEQL